MKLVEYIAVKNLTIIETMERLVVELNPDSVIASEQRTVIVETLLAWRNAYVERIRNI